jgi:hypothetical protein
MKDLPGARLYSLKVIGNKEADICRLFYWVQLYYLAAGAAASAAGAAAGAEAAAGASTAGAGAVAGLLQAAKVKAKSAAIRAERIIM